MHLSPLTPHDREAWAGLLAVAFDRPHAEMTQILDRLHATFPILAWGAWDGSTLAAQYSSLLTELHIPGATTPALVGLCINMATHPAYRGQGLIKQVAHPVYEELVACGGVGGVGFSNTAGVRVDRRSHSYGYRVIGRMQPWLAVLLRPPQAAPLQLAKNWPELPPALPRDSIHFAPTPAWLDYRFDGHPQRTYCFATYYEAGSPCEGVAYRLVRGAPGRNRRAATLLAAYGPDPAGLIARWARLLWDTGVRVIHLLTTPGTPWISALRRVALALPIPVTRHPYYLTVKPLGDQSPAALLDFTHWDCLGGDIL